MKTPLGYWLASVLVGSVMLSGCSTIASFFPDKQKQYRYSSDLPPLEIPPDLSTSSMEGVTTSKADSDSASSSRSSGPEESSASAQTSETETTEPAPKPRKKRSASKAASTTLAQNSEDAPLIEIDEPFAEAWNDVHRALGRLEIEVTDQNRSDRVFFVHYAGPDQPKKKEEDSGLWSDIKSIFRSAEAPGEDLRVKLEEGEKLTNVFVLDTADKPATGGLGLNLLRRLNDQLQKLDQPEKSSGDGESDREKSP